MVDLRIERCCIEYVQIYSPLMNCRMSAIANRGTKVNSAFNIPQSVPQQ